MEDKTAKVFMACAIGAGVGALIALELGNYLWWIGALIGGLIGYLTFEFKKVMAAALRAWERVFSKSFFLKFFSIWKMTLALPLFAVSFFATLLSPIALICLLFSGPLILVMIIAMTGATLLTTFIASIVFVFLFWDEDYFKELKNDSDGVKSLSFTFSPFMVYFYWLPKGVIWCAVSLIRNLPAIVVAICSFFRYLFMEIHSDLRLLCGVDAAIGAAVGFSCGNALIGAVAGGIIGVLNYQIISIRVLKIVPKS